MDKMPEVHEGDLIELIPICNCKVTKLIKRSDGCYTICGENIVIDVDGNILGTVLIEAPKVKFEDDETICLAETNEPFDEEKIKLEKEKYHEFMFSKKLPKWQKRKK